MLFLDIIHNLALLVALSIFSGFITNRFKEKWVGDLFQGIVFGTVAVVGMLRPLVLSPGLIFDGRSVVLSLCAFFFGPLSAGIAGGMAIVCRVLLGGVGAYMGVSVILSSIMIGLVFHLLRVRRENMAFKWYFFLMFGFLVHAAMLFLMLTLPHTFLLETLARVGLPVMTVYPLATVLIGKVLSEHEVRRNLMEQLTKSEKRFRAIFNSTFQFTGLMTPDGILIEANETAMSFAGVGSKDVINRPFWETHWWKGDEKRVKQLKEAIKRAASGEFVRYAVELQGSGGTTAMIDFSIKPILDNNGKVVLLIPEGRDVSERNEIEKNLRTTNKQLKDIIEFLPDPTFIIDKEKKIIAWNKAIEEMTGVSKSEILGKDHSYSTIPFYGERRPYLMDIVLDDTKEVSIKYDYVKKNGTAVYGEAFAPALYGNKGAYIWATAGPLFNAGGEAVGVIESIRDITERKKAEDAIKESEGKFRSLYGSMMEMLVIHEMIYDHNGEAVDYRILECNEAYLGIMNTVRDLVIGKMASEVYAGVPPYLDKYKKVAETGEPYAFETYYAPIKKYFSISAFSYKKGFFATVTTDITERKKVEIERNRFFNFSIDMLSVSGVDGYYKQINPAFEKILGWTKDEILARPHIEFVHPDDKRATIDTFASLLVGNEVMGFENRYIKKDGEYVWISWNAFPLIEEGLIFSVGRDITEYKKAQEILKHDKERAERANKAKSEFLANISHDIRTPMNAIMGFGTLLQSEQLNEKQRRFIGIIQENSKDLLALLDDVLDISRVESGKMAFRMAEFDLKNSIKKAMEMAQNEIGTKSVLITSRFDGASWRFKGDPLRVGQVFTNILSNAVKYTEKGEINIVVTSYPAKEKGMALVRVSVKDTGLGIPKDKLDNIFEPFTRFHEFYDGKRYKGVGLGLHITKTLVNLMGGEISVISEEGKGSEFIFTLELESL